MTLANYTPEQCRAIGWGDKADRFSRFMNAVNAHVEALCGMSIEDLADWDFASAFEDEQDPEEVAEELLADQGFDFGH